MGTGYHLFIFGGFMAKVLSDLVATTSARSLERFDDVEVKVTPIRSNILGEETFGLCIQDEKHRLVQIKMSKEEFISLKDSMNFAVSGR
jgi:hypothetical protein